MNLKIIFNFGGNIWTNGTIPATRTTLQRRLKSLTANILPPRNYEINIGLSTVYRHLERLVGENKVRKFISSAGESACFQEQNKKCEHFHLKCTVCGKLEHLSCKTLEEISAHVLSEHGFSIDPAKTVFYGKCRECGAK